MTTLYNKISKVLNANGKTTEDIEWVGSAELELDLKVFLQMAKETEYGSELSPYDLKIVGQTWWLEVGGSKGVERLEFKTQPTRPGVKRTPERITSPSNIGGTVKDITGEGKFILALTSKDVPTKLVGTLGKGDYTTEQVVEAINNNPYLHMDGIMLYYLPKDYALSKALPVVDEDVKTETLYKFLTTAIDGPNSRCKGCDNPDCLEKNC